MKYLYWICRLLSINSVLKARTNREAIEVPISEHCWPRALPVALWGPRSGSCILSSGLLKMITRFEHHGVNIETGPWMGRGDRSLLWGPIQVALGTVWPSINVRGDQRGLSLLHDGRLRQIKLGSELSSWGITILYVASCCVKCQQNSGQLDFQVTSRESSIFEESRSALSNCLLGLPWTSGPCHSCLFHLVKVPVLKQSC